MKKKNIFLMAAVGLANPRIATYFHRQSLVKLAAVTIEKD